MTIEDCRQAEQVYNMRRYLRALLHNEEHNYVDTEKLSVGIGDVTVSLHIPWEVCRDIIEKQILDVEAWLMEHGIEYDF